MRECQPHLASVTPAKVDSVAALTITYQDDLAHIRPVAAPC
jgi:hypothetical protein